MAHTDPIADYLTRIRNAVQAKKKVVDAPFSNMKLKMSEILKQNNFIDDFGVVGEGPIKSIRIKLKYKNGVPAISGLEKISVPGLRRYVNKNDVPRVFNGLGISIVSTSKGLLTDKQAKSESVGGEVICRVW
jgi:small subunit ribosomal protein S8